MVKKTNDKVKVVDLLPMEEFMARFGHAQAMTTLTWFQGDTSNATALLKGRADALLRVNPWLAGRVRKTRKGMRGSKWSLVYNPQLAKGAEDSYFRVITDAVSRDVPLVDLGSKLKDHVPKTGPDEPLWRVAVCPCAKNPTTRFAVLVSLSHIVGDGHTFFKLQNVVLGSSRVESQESFLLDRITTTGEQQTRAMGGRKEYSLMFSAGFISNFLLGAIRATCLQKYKASAKIFLVDPEGMEQAKQDAVQVAAPAGQRANDVTTVDNDNTGVSAGPPEFVSSNDVLSSWFFQNSNCTHGLMSVNFRGRLKGHTDRHAGNYENNLCYPRKDSVTPNLIRKSISAPSAADSNESGIYYQRYLTRNEPLPPSWKLAFGSSFAVCSNWASFALPSDLGEGYVEEVQIPVYEVVVPSTAAACVVFRAGPKGLAVIVAGSKDKLKGLEKQVPFLKPYHEEH